MTRDDAARLFVLLLAWDYLDDYLAGALLDGEDHRDIAAQMDEVETELAEYGILDPVPVLDAMRARDLA